MATINEFRQELWDLKRYGLRSGGLIVLSEDNLKRLLRDFDDALDLDPSMFEDELDNPNDNKTDDDNQDDGANEKSDEDITGVDLTSPKLNDESLVSALGLHNQSNNNSTVSDDAIRPTHHSEVTDVDDGSDDSRTPSYTISSTATYPDKPEGSNTDTSNEDTIDSNNDNENTNITESNKPSNVNKNENAGDVFNSTLNNGLSSLDDESTDDDVDNPDSNTEKTPFDDVAAPNGIENSGVDDIPSNDIRPTASNSNPSKDDSQDSAKHSNDSSEPDANSLAGLELGPSNGAHSSQFTLDGLINGSSNSN